MAKVVIKSGLREKMATFAPTRHKAKRVEIAINDMAKTDADALCRAGRAKKMKVKGEDKIYMYRVNARDRIIFSPVGDTNVILDVVSPKTREITK